MAERIGQPETHAAHDAGGAHAHYDPAGSRLGMWLFLFTEAFLFGTMFIAYAVLLKRHGWQFRDGAHSLNKLLGAANTLILLTSSLTMALSIAALLRRRAKACLALMSVTVLLAVAFLVIKTFEWSAKFEHGLYPRSESMAAKSPGVHVYFGLYYLMTGLHGLHVVIGAAVILWAMTRVRAGRVHAGRPTALENVGLYWHLVDVIWIFLFPLFYLIG